MKITVLGGTGYTGGNIVREAASRGHEVTSFSRTAPTEPIDGVTYVEGSLLDDGVRAQAVAGADVVIGAIAPRGELEGEVIGVYGRIAELAAGAGARFGVVGGFSALRSEPGAPRFAEGDVPPQFAVEAREMVTVLENLQTAAPAELDWFFVSPAANYGSYAPGEAKGTYRVGGDIALFDDNNESAVSGADFALAIVDEIERPAHQRAHLSVAY